MPKLSEITGTAPRKLKLSDLGDPNDSDFARMVKGEPKRMSLGDEVKRTAGLGARAAISGPLEFAGIFTDPLAHVFGLPSARQGAQQLGDKLGLPNPSTGAERVSQDVSKAITGGVPMVAGANLAAKAPGLVGAVGQSMAVRPGLQFLSAGTGAASASGAREAGASPGVQIAAGLAGGLAPGAVPYSGGAALRYMLRGGEEGRQAMAGPLSAPSKGSIRGGTLADFAAVGARPSVGQATGNRRTQGLESLLSGAPTSTGRMATFAEGQANDIGQGLQARANTLYPNASAERAGLAVDRGVQGFTGNVKAQRNALYAKADQLIPQGSISPLQQTWNALRDLTRPNPGAPATTAAMVNPKIAGLFKTVGEDLARNGGKGLPYETVKDIRSRIGRELSDFALTTDKPTAEYKRLYAALSQDMEAAAKAAGPAAEAAAKRANNYFRASQQRLEVLERVVDKAGGPERIYQAALSGTKDGATTLRAVMRSLPKESQQALTAAVIKRLGLATKGNQNAEGSQFSAQTFLTNWNGLSAEARGALFGPHQQTNAKFVADMDKIARVADRIRTGSKVFANPSGTANRAAALSYWLSLAGAAGTGQGQVAATIAAGGIGANGVARAMTNPRFVNWLARSTDMPTSVLPQQALVLKRIAAEDDNEAIDAFADQLTKRAPQ